MTTLLYSWRNLWRNSRRTIITLVALALNTAVLITTLALIDGYIENAVATATELVVGEAQIHVEDYISDPSLFKWIEDPERIVAAAARNGIAATKRVYGYGLISVGKKSAGARFWGVNPADETATFRLASHVAEGEFLGDKNDGGLVLGKKLARSLNAEIGQEIIVVAQAADGSIAYDLYHVTGILKSAGETLDRSAAIFHEADFRELFVMDEGYHEIALNSMGNIQPENFTRLIGGSLGDAELKTWRQLLPAFSDIINLSRASIGIVMAIFFIAAGLGIMNTMLMVTYDRLREFGILKALGTGPWRIIGFVLMEAFMLSVLATIFGIIIGWAGGSYFQAVGIDTGKWAGETSFAGVAFDPMWRAAMSWDIVITPVITMWITCVLASLYPAILAARLEPVKAMEHV
jgi:ABC-type lipoprotein release transport system permease subunit